MVRTVKQPVSSELRQLILELRRSHSLQQVADKTGVPIGTVKTICSRSGIFRNNPKHRTLFSLPPIIESASTAISVQAMPLQQVVTGDKEIDAVLWLQQVVSTGQEDLIAKAMQAIQRIKTPIETLEKRYRDMIIAKNPGNLFATLSTIGFGDLEGKAKKAVKRNASANEALARFGSETAVFSNTPAEEWILMALKGIKFKEKHGFPELDSVVIAAFQARGDGLPHTLDDCVHELRYWDELYRLRHSVDRDCGGIYPEEGLRRDFLFWLLARTRPTDKHEALSVMKFMIAGDHMDRKGGNDILLNLFSCGLGSGRKS